MPRKNQTNYDDNFRSHIVRLAQAGGRAVPEISREYGLSKATVYAWVRKSEATGSFRDRDNRTPEENELAALRKKVRTLEMELDLLKQAALIMARR